MCARLHHQLEARTQAPRAPGSGCSLNLMAAPTQQELGTRACASAAAADCSGAFFSRDAAAGALPLVDLPEPVVRMVLQEGKTPHGAPRWCLTSPRANECRGRQGLTRASACCVRACRGRGTLQAVCSKAGRAKASGTNYYRPSRTEI